MMAHAQSSPATDHRFCPIMGCSAVAGLPCDPSDPSVTPEPGAWGHGFLLLFQWVAAPVTPVTPYSTKETCGKQALATGQLRDGAHTGWANIGNLGSLGSQVGCQRSSPLSDDGSFPRGTGRGDSDPRKKTSRQKFSHRRASKCYNITLTSRTFWGLKRPTPPRIISGPLRGLALFRLPLPPEPAESLPPMK